MSRTNKTIRLSAKAFLLSMGLTLAACGGGGGGGGTTYPSIQYSGTTTAATVTQDNAADFPITMLEGSTRSDSANTLSIISDNISTQSVQRSTLLKSGTNIIKDSILSALSSNTTTSASVAGITESLTGTCPTSGTFTATINSSNGSFSGTLIFNHFCIGTATDSGTVHGKITFTGTYHLDVSDNPIYDTLSINMEYVKFSLKSPSLVYDEEFSGNFVITQFDGSIENNVLNVTFSSNFKSEGETFRVENLTFDTSGITTLNLSGRFYHPVHGYIEATTTEPFDIIFGNPTKYCSGTLLLTGDGGTVEFTANADCSQYSVTFTATGNVSGIPDYDSGMVVWP